ncbi:MAG: T9SS type A sorting domain-containing protein [Weeksellaceae bacterium]
MRFLFFIPLVICLFSLKGQDYTPLLNNQNEWHLLSIYDGNAMTDVYYTDGDTIADGRTYKILDGYHYISRTFWLRENVSEKKVFFKMASYAPNEEKVLYNFSLGEGDSIQMLNPITPFPEDLGYFKLDSIRMKPVLNDQNSRFFYFSPTESNDEGFGYLPVWVEGMGSLSLINAPGGNPDFYGVGQISCFWKNSNLFYQDSEMQADCQSVLNTHDVNKRNYKFAVTQNKIGVLMGAEKISHLEIYDLRGKKYKSLKNNSQSRIEIDLTSFPKGVYVLRINENHRVQNISFLVK